MKPATATRCSTIVLLACLLSGLAGPAAPDVRAAIAEAWKQHIEAARNKDLEAVLRIYADDVVYIVPGHQDVRGRKAIAAMESETLAAADVLEAVHRTESLRVFDDLAYELGTVVGPVRQKGQPEQTVTFHFMATWRRQADGSWRIECMVGEPDPDVTVRNFDELENP